MEISGPVIAVIGISATAVVTASVFGVRKLIQMGQYSYHNARLSTIGNPYVRKEELLQLTDLGDPSPLHKSIQGDLSLRDEPGSFREADGQLMHSFHGSLNSLLKGSPEQIRPLVSSYIHIWEVEELKRLLRLVGHRTDPLYPVGFLDHDLESQFLKAKDLSQAMEVLEGQKVGKAMSPLTKDEDVGLDEIDSVLDRYVLDELQDVGDLSFGSRRGARHFSDIMIDRYNLHYIARSKVLGKDRDEVLSHLYTKGGTIGIPLLEQMVESANLREALTVLNETHLEPLLKGSLEKGIDSVETNLDRMLLNGSIGLSNSYVSSVGPTIRFMVSKEMEMKNLRTLYQGAFSGWRPERTREQLVMEELMT